MTVFQRPTDHRVQTLRRSNQIASNSICKFVLIANFYFVRYEDTTASCQWSGQTEFTQVNVGEAGAKTLAETTGKIIHALCTAMIFETVTETVSNKPSQRES